MEISFLDNQEESDKLILIFPGWSFGKDYYTDIHFPGWNTAVVEDYLSPELDQSTLHNYSTIYLFAWSMGVFMASMTGIGSRVTSAFAINGTPFPADDDYGIPKAIFETTAARLSPLSLRKFRRRMAGNSNNYALFHDLEFPKEKVENLKEQLLAILRLQQSRTIKDIPWKRIYISEEDAIFPFENQKKFWIEKYRMGRNGVTLLREPHYVDMESLIRISIPSKEKVARNFTNAAFSYEDHAKAQRILADSLTELIKETGLRDGEDILEIGCGTGLLTSNIIREFRPAHIDLVDISSIRPSTEPITSEFFEADAEKWIEDCSRKYGAVLSSATVQWFVNLRLFIKNTSRCLKKNGVLGFSTFLPGNLHELDILRPSPLNYHSAVEIQSMMTEFFSEIRVKEKEIILNFNSPFDLLHHLKATGVGGSAPEKRLPLSKIRDLKSLTFRGICITGIKKE